MKKTVVLYSLGIALAALALQWLEYQYAVRRFSVEIYLLIIAIGFAGLGIWIGHRLTAKPARDSFLKNEQAIAYLGISEREYEVLEQLSAGLSNREIAEKLFVSANTVKTHVASLYAKLEVGRRTQAIQKARSLRIIP